MHLVTYFYFFLKHYKFIMNIMYLYYINLLSLKNLHASVLWTEIVISILKVKVLVQINYYIVHNSVVYNNKAHTISIFLYPNVSGRKMTLMLVYFHLF